MELSLVKVEKSYYKVRFIDSQVWTLEVEVQRINFKIESSELEISIK